MNRGKQATSDSEIDSPAKHKHKISDWSSDSEVVSPVKQKTKYLNGNPNIPVFAETADRYTATEIDSTACKDCN